MTEQKAVTPESIAAQACEESHAARGTIFGGSPYDCALRAAKIALAAAPSAKQEPVAVKVKPLKWRRYGNQNVRGWQAQGVLGYLQYVVDRGPEGEEGWFFGDAWFEREEDALSAVKSDYESCILSGIEPAPDLAAENARLREENAEAIPGLEICDAVMQWMVKHGFIDADEEYRDSDIIEVLDALISDEPVLDETARVRNAEEILRYINGGDHD